MEVTLDDDQNDEMTDIMTKIEAVGKTTLEEKLRAMVLAISLVPGPTPDLSMLHAEREERAWYATSRHLPKRGRSDLIERGHAK